MMTATYSVEVCRILQDKFRGARLHRRLRIARYDPGDQLSYNVTSVEGSNSGQVKLTIEKFIGGGYAGQVYRVRILNIQADNSRIGALEADGVYAMKILVPPSKFAQVFRNMLYWIGFQGPFQMQVNPVAARAGALWQKFVRRAAKVRFGSEDAVVDIHATFVDSSIGSCGELSEWIEGRTWQLEADEYLDVLKRWRKGWSVDNQLLGSPEYRAKKQFMAEFVKLLHEIGGCELARQYEWSTCKSQPNCLKRKGTENDPAKGLVAVDFRAGLTLLPFLPMSPGDFALIAKGLARGSIVQFDRGSITKLEAFMQANSSEFADMNEELGQLKEAESVYRNSIPDITHNHVRLLYSRKLWSTILDSARTSWDVRNYVDADCRQKLNSSTVLTVLFLVIGAIPFLGPFIRRIWGRQDWRKHYGAILTSWDYLKRALAARMAEKVISWYRAGRVDTERALKLAERPWRFFFHVPLSMLPAALHRSLTDQRYVKERLAYLFVRPVRLYFNTQLREQWLNDMVAEGQKKHILSNDDAGAIFSQVKEPFIQKYLKSLAVHVCTLPVTQVVSLLVATIYVMTHPELSWDQAGIRAGAILVAFQITPISPGSLVRGFYVLYLVLREKNFKDYNIAVFLSFFKYIGYLAFPIQMTYHYPTLARFMAGHWATEAVHIVPVFGEQGALLEHWVFSLFYNWPLTVRRRMGSRAKIRASMKPRYWHIGLCAIAAAAIFALMDSYYLKTAGHLASLKEIWYLAVLVPLICGTAVTLGCGGALLWKRIVAATICGAMAAVIYTAGTAMLDLGDVVIGIRELVISCAWRTFVFTIFTTIGAIITELKLPDPQLR